MAITIEPRWLTADVVGVARGIYESHDMTRLPLLADALMDAGCDDERVLRTARRDVSHADDDDGIELVLASIGIKVRQVVAMDERRTGRKARIVSDSILRDTAMAAARSKGRRAWEYQHGGGVANKYGYPASTDAVVCVGLRLDTEIVVVMWATEIPANKVTLGGVMASCLGNECRPVCDDRYGDDAKDRARKSIYAAAEREAGILVAEAA